jgi:triosephosphate isomerase (TIM)
VRDFYRIMNKPFIIANWKCNPQTSEKAHKLFSDIKKSLPKKLRAKIVICPPFIFLPQLVHRKIAIGAQDCFYKSGTYTGEISAVMLKKLGVKYVIIGHSERRALKETDSLINQKIRSALGQNLKPVFCVGESQADKEKNKTSQKLKKQIQKGLKGISLKDISKVIIAYEPIWAIGSGKPCQAEEVMVIKLLIRSYLRELFSKKEAEKVKILYGGSLNSKNALSYTEEAKTDGLLVGGASLKSKEFIAILKLFC